MFSASEMTSHRASDCCAVSTKHPDYEHTEDRKKKARAAKLSYRKRKAAGLCTVSGCSAKCEQGHANCRSHLRLMSENNKARYRERAREAICIYCGERPSFWGVRCIVCRQRFAKDPLPFGARRALRLYREAEERRAAEQLQIEARKTISELLAGRKVKGQCAEALWLYAGFDTGKWRTYKEVGDRMNLSKERVRQILLTSKLTLARALNHRLPWRPLQGPAANVIRDRHNHAPEE